METKKIICTLTVLLLLQQVFAQTPRFTLKGRLNVTHMDSVMLYYDNGGGQYSYQIKPVFDGSFIINDSLQRPIRALVLFKNIGETISDKDFETRAKEIYLEPGILLLTGDPGKISTLRLSGSYAQKELDTLNGLTTPVRGADATFA